MNKKNKALVRMGLKEVCWWCDGVGRELWNIASKSHDGAPCIYCHGNGMVDTGGNNNPFKFRG